MADLNQMIKGVKSGWDLESHFELMLCCVTNYEKAVGNAPVCCFYTCEANEIDSEMVLDGFRNYAASQEELVIGCSRGCLPLEDVKRGKIQYRKKLCKGCVKEAGRIIKDGS